MMSYTKITLIRILFSIKSHVYRMTSGSGGRDPAWRYCAPLEGHRNETICNYCGLSIKSGGLLV